MNALANEITVQAAFSQAQVTGDTNSSQIVDLLGVYQVAFVFNVSALAAADASNYLTVKVQETDSATFADAGDITTVTDTAARIVGTQLVLNATTQTGPHVFGVTVGTKRYLRLVLDETGTFDGTLCAVAVCRGRHQNIPTPAAPMN